MPSIEEEANHFFIFKKKILRGKEKSTLLLIAIKMYGYMFE